MRVDDLTKTEAFKKHKKVIDKYRKRLLKAESVAKDIRTNPEWVSAYTYFQVLATRGKLEKQVTAENGYEIVLKGEDR